MSIALVQKRYSASEFFFWIELLERLVGWSSAIHADAGIRYIIDVPT